MLLENNMRIPPHSAESEAGVLGSVLLKPELIEEIELRSEQFYDRRNQILWETLKEMSASTKAMDAITIGTYLADTGNLDKIGGYDRLLDLQHHAVVPSHSQSYAEEVRVKAELRREIEIYSEGIDESYKGNSSGDQIISQIMAGDNYEECTIEDIMQSWDSAADGVLQTIPTPYPDLDRHTGGIKIGMPTVFTGRSKSGKSMFLAGWYNYLGERGIPIMVLPFEDGYHITLTRMAANFGNYEWGKVENGGKWRMVSGQKLWEKITPKELATAKKCLAHVQKLPVHFLDRQIRPNELAGHVSRFKRRHEIKAFFVDGAKDFIKPAGKYNDVGFDEECSQVIKRTCKEVDVAGVVVHHLTKIDETDLITVNNIRGSGNIVSDSRSVYALQSAGLEKAGVSVSTDDFGRITTRRFDCLANNHGAEGSVLLDSDLSKCSFYEQRG